MKDDVTVYIVDDEPIVVKSIVLLVEFLGWEARSFLSAEEFLAGFEPDRPGCILLDYKLPGINGLELLSQLQSREDTLPVVMITGHGDGDAEDEAMQLGAVDFLYKPFPLSQLTTALERAVALSREARQSGG